MNRYIVVRVQFEAIHNWPDCDLEEVSYLRNLHRHIFYVTVKWKVEHNNRDKEFIIQKRKVQEYVNSFGFNIGRLSCEDIAETIFNKFSDCCYVSVFEDNENGAELIAKGND